MTRFTLNKTAAALALATATLPAAQAAGPQLNLSVYNPADKAIFPVSSSLVTGKHDAILIDAQFARKDAEALVKQIKDSGKTLTTVYISHGDPDYYFGLDTIKAAFPNARVLATGPTIAHIKATMNQKLAFWGPKLGNDAPARLIVPEPIKGDTLKLEGRELKVIGVDGARSELSVVWIPSLRTVTGGVPVVGNQHVWMADSKTPEARKTWKQTLDRISALHPVKVVPGHYLPGAKLDLTSVRFTRDYIDAIETELPKAADSKALVEAMKLRYPNLGGEADLELGAKVLKGEMPW
ncbi:MBL fold metallo-hydrolase [Paludibacterium paludis]|uniref:MBL fold metallo-hydrolase n=1 Tax=Paludibacterium paludis TaxID=1225769 RepID=A0A918P3Q0_9NEIS|nr:MBL fold metallo-hydrolase [Paludibacterium paludis]GGY16948.1 MBL fold metallo-hydrolase [Paludibacterium paludis]